MSQQSSRKLYSLLGDFQMFRSFSVDRISTQDASNMPFMIWPNGSPCLIGNLYMQSLLVRRGRSGGLSRKGRKGGTMAGYAANVGQLLRLCYQDGIDPIYLTDGKFTDYIDEIRLETSSTNPSQSKKSQNAVIATGKRWLDFLGFVGRYYRRPDFVSQEGAIRAKEEVYYVKSRSGKSTARIHMWHHSFGNYHRPHTRDPITDDQIKRLKAAVRKTKSSAFCKVRMARVIDMLDDTGARRSEVAMLTVADVKAAMAMYEACAQANPQTDPKELPLPLLRFDTLKREDGAERFVPVPLMTLHRLNQYIEGERRTLMRKVYKRGKDHGFVFVSSRTGAPLSSDSITNEVRKLRKAAGIECQICPHMFRHAFITKLFVKFITRHSLNNPDEFRRALLDAKTFFAEVISWTGHLDPTSLEHYIHLAFRDMANYTETLTSVHMLIVMDKYFAEEAELQAQLEEGMPIAKYLAAMKELKELYTTDMEVAQRRESNIA